MTLHQIYMFRRPFLIVQILLTCSLLLIPVYGNVAPETVRILSGILIYFALLSFVAIMWFDHFIKPRLPNAEKEKPSWKNLGSLFRDKMYEYESTRKYQWPQMLTRTDRALDICAFESEMKSAINKLFGHSYLYVDFSSPLDDDIANIEHKDTQVFVTLSIKLENGLTQVTRHSVSRAYLAQAVLDVMRELTSTLDLAQANASLNIKA